ncbi:hypothetical protein MNBD_ALPHA08-1832 [hydrothermal vent metagenome]|uniref:DUF3108 domain-containing protein n=1 Tax=hydrothermal vent metagenome TaxID=652676 RepID=A0A3B0SAD7_9ZZZZ
MKNYHIGRKATAKKWLIPAIFASVILTAATLQTPAAFAVEKEQANLSYNVFVGTSKMFKIGLQTTITATTYSSYMRLKPKGLAKLFANISMVMNVSGRVEKDAIQPEKFSFYRKKKKRKRTSNIVWARSGDSSTSRTYKVSAARQVNLTKAINNKVPDPLSAFLRMGITDAKSPCGKSQRIYDGGKVYDLKFTLLGKTVLGSRSKGAYRGPAFKCRLSHKPVAGYSNKDLAKARKNPAVFTVWFAPVKSTVLNRDILLPVVATGRLKGRAFSAYTKSATFAGKPI